MLATTGYSSAIIRQLALLIPNEEIMRIDYGSYQHYMACADRFVLCAGLMIPRRGIAQAAQEITNSMRVNYLFPITVCDEILKSNSKARICVVGSESGITGSYDDVYAAAKAAVHAYVERKRLSYPDQQLVAIAPSIIEDCGMTLRRQDRENLEFRRTSHPKQRFLKAQEVARLIHFLLYVDAGYISGVTVRMNGGAHISSSNN